MRAPSPCRGKSLDQPRGGKGRSQAECCEREGARPHDVTPIMVFRNLPVRGWVRGRLLPRSRWVRLPSRRAEDRALRSDNRAEPKPAGRLKVPGGSARASSRRSKAAAPVPQPRSPALAGPSPPAPRRPRQVHRGKRSWRRRRRKFLFALVFPEAALLYFPRGLSARGG